MANRTIYTLDLESFEKLKADHLRLKTLVRNVRRQMTGLEHRKDPPVPFEFGVLQQDVAAYGNGTVHIYNWNSDRTATEHHDPAEETCYDCLGYGASTNDGVLVFRHARSGLLCFVVVESSEDSLRTGVWQGTPSSSLSLTTSAQTIPFSSDILSNSDVFSGADLEGYTVSVDVAGYYIVSLTCVAEHGSGEFIEYEGVYEAWLEINTGTSPTGKIRQSIEYVSDPSWGIDTASLNSAAYIGEGVELRARAKLLTDSDDIDILESSSLVITLVHPG